MKEKGLAVMILNAEVHLFVVQALALGMAQRIAVANPVMAVQMHAIVQSQCAKRKRGLAAMILNALPHWYV